MDLIFTWAVWSCLLVIPLIFWFYTMIDRVNCLCKYLQKGCHGICHLFFPLLACTDCLFNRRNPVVMWAVPAALGWLHLPSGRGGRQPLSPAPVIPPHPLKLRARGSAGTFPPTAPGQLLAFGSPIISVFELCMKAVHNNVQHNSTLSLAEIVLLSHLVYLSGESRSLNKPDLA